ncbi:MAG: hypothetical protein R3Y43_08615, partial [Alphaproteobacteria bacterium]
APAFEEPAVQEYSEPTDLGAPSFEEPTAPAFEEPAVQEYSEPTDLGTPSFAEPTAPAFEEPAVPTFEELATPVIKDPMSLDDDDDSYFIDNSVSEPAASPEASAYQEPKTDDL